MQISKRDLYLECHSGISGDMAVAALLDLGADEQKLRDVLESLDAGEFAVEIKRVKKNGISALDFGVILKEEGDGHSHHDRDNHTHHHEHGEHTHHHDHESHLPHRNLRDVMDIINKSSASDRAKEIAEDIFKAVADAEAAVHDETLDNIHFHEVGAIDSIVDILAAAVCIDDLEIDDIYVSELTEGSGTVVCQHGIIPVPVPAVCKIAEMYGLSLKLINVEGELVTPTGAAIAAALKTKPKLPQSFTIKKVGVGAGKRNYETAGIFRAMLIEL